jgi:hypothetical protein
MSYNLLSGSVEFIGPALGEIEDIVNTHGTQTITGPKTFTNITASGGNTVGLTVAGELHVDSKLVHSGDADTYFNFSDNSIFAFAGSSNVGSGRILRMGATSPTGEFQVNPDNKNIDFEARSGNSDLVIKLHANRRAVTIGSSQTPANSDVMVSLSSSFHTGSLFSVGDIKNPILAVSGGNGSHANWKVKVSGTLATDGNITPAGNVIAGGYVTGSLGLRGELLNTGNGLENSVLDGELKLSVKPSATNQYLGIRVGTDGTGLDVTGLAEEGSLNTDTAQPDWVIVADNNGAGSYTNKKQKVSVLLGSTLSTVANIGTGVGIYSSVLNKEIKLRSIKTSDSLLSATVVSDDVVIQPKANPAITALTSSNTVFSGSTKNAYAVATVASHGQNVLVTHPAPRYQILNAAGNPFNATASLPQITGTNVGMLYHIKFLSTEECKITGSIPPAGGSNQLIDGSEFITISGGTPGNAKFRELLAIDITGAGSYEWVVVSGN